MESIIRDALKAKGIAFIEGDHPDSKGLDFYLPAFDVHIEVKQFHSERISRQMASAPNVIAVQGEEAVKLLARYILGEA